jgi:hypothetical protein
MAGAAATAAIAAANAGSEVSPMQAGKPAQAEKMTADYMASAQKAKFQGAQTVQPGTAVAQVATSVQPGKMQASDSTLNIAGKPVVKGQPLTSDQMAAIGMALSMNPANAKNYPDWVLAQYNKQKSQGAVSSVTPGAVGAVAATGALDRPADSNFAGAGRGSANDPRRTDFEKLGVDDKSLEKLAGAGDKDAIAEYQRRRESMAKINKTLDDKTLGGMVMNGDKDAKVELDKRRGVGELDPNVDKQLRTQTDPTGKPIPVSVQSDPLRPVSVAVVEGSFQPIEASIGQLVAMAKSGDKDAIAELKRRKENADSTVGKVQSSVTMSDFGGPKYAQWRKDTGQQNETDLLAEKYKKHMLAYEQARGSIETPSGSTGIGSITAGAIGSFLNMSDEQPKDSALLAKEASAKLSEVNLSNLVEKQAETNMLLTALLDKQGQVAGDARRTVDVLENLNSKS